MPGNKLKYHIEVVERDFKTDPPGRLTLVGILDHLKHLRLQNHVHGQDGMVTITWDERDRPHKDTYPSDLNKEPVARTIRQLLQLPPPIPRLDQPCDFNLSSPIKRWPIMDSGGPWRDFTGENVRGYLTRFLDCQLDGFSSRFGVPRACTLQDLVECHNEWHEAWNLFPPERSLRLLPRIFPFGFLGGAFLAAQKEISKDMDSTVESTVMIRESDQDRDPAFRITRGRFNIDRVFEPDSKGNRKNSECLVAGDVLFGQKWGLEDALHSGDPSACSPLVDMANYCLLSGTRYGMILSETELVVLQFHVRETPGESRHKRFQLGCKFKSIPWMSNEDNELTILEAMFAITLLSLYNKEGRKMNQNGIDRFKLATFARVFKKTRTGDLEEALRREEWGTSLFSKEFAALDSQAASAEPEGTEDKNGVYRKIRNLFARERETRKRKHVEPVKLERTSVSDNQSDGGSGTIAQRVKERAGRAEKRARRDF